MHKDRVQAGLATVSRSDALTPYGLRNGPSLRCAGLVRSAARAMFSRCPKCRSVRPGPVSGVPWPAFVPSCMLDLARPGENRGVTDPAVQAYGGLHTVPDVRTVAVCSGVRLASTRAGTRLRLTRLPGSVPSCSPCKIGPENPHPQDWVGQIDGPEPLRRLQTQADHVQV